MRGSMMDRPAKIILANHTRLLRELLKRAICKSPHLRLVGEVSDSRGVSKMIQETEAQWVVVSLPPDGMIPESAEMLLKKNPSVHVLAVASDGSELRLGWTEAWEGQAGVDPQGTPMELRWTEPHERLLENLSLEDLITIFREGALWNLILAASQT